MSTCSHSCACDRSHACCWYCWTISGYRVCCVCCNTRGRLLLLLEAISGPLLIWPNCSRGEEAGARRVVDGLPWRGTRNRDRPYYVQLLLKRGSRSTVSSGRGKKALRLAAYRLRRRGRGARRRLTQSIVRTGDVSYSV